MKLSDDELIWLTRGMEFAITYFRNAPNEGNSEIWDDELRARYADRVKNLKRLRTKLVRERHKQRKQK